MKLGVTHDVMRYNYRLSYLTAVQHCGKLATLQNISATQRYRFRILSKTTKHITIYQPSPTFSFRSIIDSIQSGQHTL